IDMTVEEEQLTIAAAQSGDEAAKLQLLQAYAPLMKNTIRTLSVESGAVDDDDLRMAAVVGVLRAIERFDPEKATRLAADASKRVRDEVSEAAGTAHGFIIPQRTLSRFFS